MQVKSRNLWVLAGGRSPEAFYPPIVSGIFTATTLPRAHTTPLTERSVSITTLRAPISFTRERS